MRILNYLSTKSKTELIVWAVFLVIIVGALDYWTGYEIAFSIFYLLPVSFAAWLAGRTPAIYISILSAGTWLMADLSAGHTYGHYSIPVWNSIARLCVFLLIAYFLTFINKLLMDEKELARHDPLTGAANHRSFTELTSRELKRALRFKRPLSIAYMDIDNFKKINDTFGHSAGDSLLAVLADTIKKNTRTMDITARLGGDEFAIVMPETRAEQAKAATSKLQNIILEAMQKHDWAVTMSIGVVTCSIPPCSVDELIKMADNLMYSAKNSGKNSIKYVVV